MSDAERARKLQRLLKLKALRSQVAAEIRAVESDLGIRRHRSKYAPPSCGTASGYQWHRYQWQKDPENNQWPLPPDDPCGCRAAHANQKRLRRRDTKTRPRKVA